jgi:hypothetical protein
LGSAEVFRLDRNFKRATDAGERNRTGFELVRNWCAHVRIEKFGGTGVIEEMTGLPIGNHGLKCDHATPGGIYSWDIRESALDFYDRNCVDCKKRKPAGVPNLLMWVKERDEASAAEAERADAERARQEAARDARRLVRSRLRENLATLSGTIMDHIDEFDDNRDQEHRDRLCESARLAPEHFVAPLVSYIFDLTEQEPWFAEAGLTILDHVKADPIRMARLALGAIGNTWPIDTPARVLLDRLVVTDADKVADALPAVIELASPSDDFFPGPTRSVPPKPELLRGLFATHRAAVRKGLTGLFSSRRYRDVELAARGLLALADSDSLVFTFFHRTMVATFSRAPLLLDDFDENRSAFRYLRDALVVAFTRSPQEVDALVQEYITASDSISRARAYKIYEAACRGRRFGGQAIPPDTAVNRICFKRLLWATTVEESDDILRSALDVFNSRPYEMIEIARAELDNLLGAVLLLDDRLRRHDETSPAKDEIFLEQLERRNRRMTITSLMGSLIEWASMAAKDDPALIKKVVDMFDRIPEGRDYLKGLSLGCIEHLGETVEGLKLLLPHLYYGLVGPSVVVRSYAAKALGKAPHDNIPPLVYEAFSVLLWDQYVAVHKSAVDALHFFQLPETVRGRSAQALLNLVSCYAQKSKEDRFLIKCICKLGYELQPFGKAKDRVERYLVKVLLGVEPLYLRNEMRSLGHTLGETEGFVDIVIKLIPYIDDHGHRRDDELSLLSELPKGTILSRKAQLEKLGIELAPTRPWLAVHLVEALARVGAIAEARKIAEAGANTLEPNLHNQAIRLSMNAVRIAVAFEESIAEGRMDDLENLAQQWDENVKTQREFEADVERRNSRSGFPRSL